MADALGIAQHHDAVTGTEKQAVAYDYAWRLAHAVSNAKPHVHELVRKLTNLESSVTIEQCMLANVSVCTATKKLAASGSLVVLVWNSIGQERSDYVEFPVYDKNVLAVDSSGEEVETVLTSALPAVGQYGGEMEPDGAPYALRFRSNVQALSFAKYWDSRGSVHKVHTRHQSWTNITHRRWNNGHDWERSFGCYIQVWEIKQGKIQDAPQFTNQALTGVAEVYLVRKSNRAVPKSSRSFLPGAIKSPGAIKKRKLPSKRWRVHLPTHEKHAIEVLFPNLPL